MDRRDDLDRLISDCKKGKIDKVILKSISRLARNTIDCLRIVRDLKLMGVSVKSEKENLDTADLSSEMLIMLPDVEKHIPADNLPFTWITQMNRWLSRMVEYDRRPEHWPEVLESVLETRKAIASACNNIIRGLDKVYRDRNTNVLFSQQSSQAITTAYARTNDRKFQLPKCAVDRYGIRADNSIVDEHDDEFILGDKAQADSSFGVVFNKYCDSWNNFFSRFISPNNLVIEKIKKIRPSNENRLSKINLISALEEIDKVQAEYLALVERQDSGEIEPIEEKASIMLLSNMWEYVYTQPFFKQRSLSSQRKQSDVKYIQRLASLFEISLPKMDDVHSYSKVGKSIYLTIESDGPCRKLFEEFKRQFSDAQTLSYKGYLFKHYLDKIYISYRVLGQELPVKCIINSNQFIIYDDVEKFMKLLMPEQNEGSKLENNLITSAIICFGNIQALPTIAKHCEQVRDKFNSTDSTYRQNHIYETWVNSVADNAITPTIEAISSSLDYSVSFIPKEAYTEAIAIHDSIREVTAAILANPQEIVEITHDEFEQLASTLENAITNYFNYFPMQ